MKTTAITTALRNLSLITLGLIITNTANSQNNRYEPTLEEMGIRFDKDTSSLQPEIGEVIQFTLTAENLLEDEETKEFSIDGSLPSGVTYLDHTVNSGNYNSTTGTWDIETIDPNSMVQLVIEGRVEDLEGFDNDNDRFKSFDESFVDKRNSLEIGMKVYPNPISENAFIEFNLPESGIAKIVIYDISGKLVKEVCNSVLFEGVHKLPLQVDYLERGFYLVKIAYNFQAETRRICLN